MPVFLDAAADILRSCPRLSRLVLVASAPLPAAMLATLATRHITLVTYRLLQTHPVVLAALQNPVLVQHQLHLLHGGGGGGGGAFPAAAGAALAPPIVPVAHPQHQAILQHLQQFPPHHQLQLLQQIPQQLPLPPPTWPPAQP